MYPENIAAKGIAALVSFLLLILPPAIFADETYGATLVAVEQIDSGQHSHRVSVQLNNRVEHLLLNAHPHLNELLIVDTEGNTHQQNGIAYTGIVESLPASSWARIVIDGDYVAGTVNTNGQSVHLSSDGSVFNTADVERTLGHDSVLLPPPLPPKRQIQEAELFEQIAVPVLTPFLDREGVVSTVARIGVVVDSLYEEAIGGRGLSKAIATINSVDGLYREKFGLALKVDVVVLITDTETLVLNGASLEDNLGLFRDYRIQSDLLPADLGLVHLFTGIETSDDSIGLAYSGAACRTDGYDVSMSRPFRYPVILAAHEIGHNLGAMHDDETTDCQSLTDNLMFSEINSTTTQEFSSCSTTAINNRLQQSACYEAAIDIGLAITQLESNQILATVTNHDTERAFPAAKLQIDLKNATIAEAPASCVLEAPTKLICTIAATYAGDEQALAVKLRLDPNEARTVNVRLDPVGFFDLTDANNAVELIIPREQPEPLASTGGEITVQGAGGSGAGNGTSGAVATGGSGGGGSFAPWLWWLLLPCIFYRHFGIHGRSKLN